MRFFVLFLLLIGCLSAQNILLGGLEIRKGFIVMVYSDDTGLMFGHWQPDGTLVSRLANGVYRSNGDRSGGSIYLDGTMDWGMKARTLAHEVCHARQDYERRLLDENECKR
jgi:hypothetical protein